MRDYDSEWDGFDNHEIIVESLMDLASGVAVGGGSVKDTAKKVYYFDSPNSASAVKFRNEKPNVPHFVIFLTLFKKIVARL